MNLPSWRAECHDGLVPKKVGVAALAPPRFMMRAQFILGQAAFHVHAQLAPSPA